MSDNDADGWVTETMETESVVYQWVPPVADGQQGQWAPQTKKVDSTTIRREYTK